MQIAAPFRCGEPESNLHKGLDRFDWMAALRMMAHSAQISSHCPVFAITDRESQLSIEAKRYDTTETRLMLWTIDVAGQFVESDDFDRDTVIVDVDQLFYRDLSPWFTKGADLTVLVRPTVKHLNGGMPLLNGCMWLSHRSRSRLAVFYARALALAKSLPEPLLRWGADTEAVCRMLEPIELGLHHRSGITVHMVDAQTVLEAFSTDQTRWLSEGRLPWPSRAVLDFRWTRKRYMAAAYHATIMRDAVLA